MPRRWRVFVHQLPAHPSNGRVKIWRRLQQVGAIALKNAVHVLPDSAQSREDVEWLREEVVALGGEASIFTVSSMSQADERYIVGELKERKTMQAIENQLDDLEDLYLAERELEEIRSGKSIPVPLAEVMKRYGMEG